MNTLFGNKRFIFHRARCRVLLAAALAACLGGCSELVLEGIVSDREYGRPVPGVAIDQRRAENWKNVGETDGNGRYWIMKNDVKGGGHIRLSKNGYYPTQMTEGEFMTGQSFLLAPTDESSFGGAENALDPRRAKRDEP